MNSSAAVGAGNEIFRLGKIACPDRYDFDRVEKTQEFYQLFWNYKLSEEEAGELLENALP